MLEIGSMIDGKYKILRKIAEGGMSIVYLAVNERANKHWAIKEVCKEGIQDDEVVKQSLISEIQILRCLNHPHLPSVIDVIDWEDALLIVMDYIEGRPLDEILREKGRILEHEAIQIAFQLCDILKYLHSQKLPIIYRDMKPSNIIVKPNGDVVLIDFGAAREFKGNKIEDTTCLGTVGYAAPEQFGSVGETDVRADIYGVGATLYHLLTGKSPAYRLHPIRYWNPAFSLKLEKIILKCMESSPDRRYQTVRELENDLLRYQNQNDYKFLHFFEWKAWTSARIDFLRYKKTNRRVSVCGMIGIIATIAVYILVSNLHGNHQNQYEIYLTRAEQEKDSLKKERLYIEAIDSDTTRMEGYLGVLDLYLSDDYLEYSRENGRDREDVGRTELQSMDELLSHFDGNQYDLTELYYKVGIAVYYYADGIGNKQGAYKYFDHVIDDNGKIYLDLSRPSSQQKVKRVECLKKIASYYAKLYRRDRAGDSLVSFQRYWDDMNRLIEENIAAEDNDRTALVVYKEFVTVVRDEIASFRDAGIEREKVERQLNTIHQYLKEQFGEDAVREKTGDMDAYQQMEKDITMIRRLIDEAEKQVDIAYAAFG